MYTRYTFNRKKRYRDFYRKHGFRLHGDNSKNVSVIHGLYTRDNSRKIQYTAWWNVITRLKSLRASPARPKYYCRSSRTSCRDSGSVVRRVVGQVRYALLCEIDKITVSDIIASTTVPPAARYRNFGRNSIISQSSRVCAGFAVRTHGYRRVVIVLKQKRSRDSSAS